MAERPLLPDALNPLLSPELQAEVAFFMKYGYLVVENAITPEQVEILRCAMDDSLERKQAEDAAAFAKTLEEEGKPAEPFVPDPNRLFGELLEEDERFEFLLDAGPVLTRMRAILGNAVQLHSATARCTRGGSVDQNWHRVRPAAPPRPLPRSAALAPLHASPPRLRLLILVLVSSSWWSGRAVGHRP